MAGRLIAAVGVVTAFLGIWLDALGPGRSAQSYWDVDGSLAGLMLGLACVAGLACLAALVLRNPALDLTFGAAGAVLFGLYLFFPAALAFADWDALDSGAWLGVCAGLIVIGAGLALSGWGRANSSPEPMALVVAAIGWGLVMAGLWVKVDEGGGSYWQPRGSGHGLGVVLLILLGLWALTALAALRRRTIAAMLLPAGIAFVILGLTLFVPTLSAFHDFGVLRAGAWLPLAGAFLLVVGSALAPRELPAGTA